MSTPSNTPQPPSEQEMAEHAARMEFLRSQALGFMNQIRMLKLQLLLADQTGDLSEEFKNYLCGELIQIAGIVEVKK